MTTHSGFDNPLLLRVCSILQSAADASLRLVNQLVSRSWSRLSGSGRLLSFSPPEVSHMNSLLQQASLSFPLVCGPRGSYAVCVLDACQSCPQLQQEPGLSSAYSACPCNSTAKPLPLDIQKSRSDIQIAPSLPAARRHGPAHAAITLPAGAFVQDNACHPKGIFKALGLQGITLSHLAPGLI